MGHHLWSWSAIEWKRTLSDWGKKPQTLPTKISLEILTRFGKSKILLWPKTTQRLTWKSKPQMNIVSWLPLTLHRFSQGGRVFGSIFLQSNFQFVPKKITECPSDSNLEKERLYKTPRLLTIIEFRPSTTATLYMYGGGSVSKLISVSAAAPTKSGFKGTQYFISNIVACWNIL